ncbi:MAG: hypothetical protein O3C65_14735 [Proteobacteria bacterium]|nr:hypothetical protein [Pseudomonadota bacterium]
MSGHYFIAASGGHGVIYFNIRRQSAWFFEIGALANFQNLPSSINPNDYNSSEWFVRFSPAGLLFDERWRLWLGAGLSPHDYWNPVYNAISRWEIGYAGSRYVTVWPLDPHVKGQVHRLWRDKLNRIWWVHRVLSALGGNKFSSIDSVSNDIVSFRLGTLGLGPSLGGPHDPWGLAGDNAGENIWVSWPRHRRIFKYPDIFTPPHLNSEIHAYFHPQLTSPDPDNAFGEPSGLMRDRGGHLYFGNRDGNYLGRLDEAAPPNEVWPLRHVAYNVKPMLMEVKATQLVVEKVFDGQVPVSSTPTSNYHGVRTPFEGWETATPPEEPIIQGDDVWFIQPTRTVARLER